MKKLRRIFKKNRVKLEIGRNRKMSVRLPSNAPKNIRFKDACRFKVTLTVKSKRKSIAKFNSAIKSKQIVIASPNSL